MVQMNDVKPFNLKSHKCDTQKKQQQQQLKDW